MSVGADGAFLVSRFADGGECESVAFHRFIKSKEEEEFDVCPGSVAFDLRRRHRRVATSVESRVRRSSRVPPWEDPRTFGRGGRCTRRRSRPSPGQPFIDPKSWDDLGEAACGSPDAAVRDAPSDDAPAAPLQRRRRRLRQCLTSSTPTSARRSTTRLHPRYPTRRRRTRRTRCLRVDLGQSVSRARGAVGERRRLHATGRFHVMTLPSFKRWRGVAVH